MSFTLRMKISELTDQLFPDDKGFTIAEAKAIADDIWENCCVDTANKFHNRFFYEVCPLLQIGQHLGDPDSVRVVFKGPTSRFDGLLILGSGRQHRVELTTAIDGHLESLRMELLAERGTAPAFQKIEASGTKGNRTFGPNETEGGSQLRYDQEILAPMIGDRIRQKLTKAISNPHYRGAWLGVVFDDFVCPLSLSKKAKRFDPICKEKLTEQFSLLFPFSRVFCVGVSRQYVFDSSKQLGVMFAWGMRASSTLFRLIYNTRIIPRGPRHPFDRTDLLRQGRRPKKYISLYFRLVEAVAHGYSDAGLVACPLWFAPGGLLTRV